MQKTITTATRKLQRPGVEPPTSERERRGGLPFIVFLFLLGLLIPLQIFVGPLRLSPYRIVLLLAIIPLIFMWLAGQAGKVRAPDFLIFGYASWGVIALMIAHGLERSIEFAGIFFVETVGSYLVARYCIRNAVQFVSVVRFVFIAIVALVPFTFYESLTDHAVLLELFGKVGTVFPNVFMEPRFGFQRAQGVFEHPILYGSFCASAFGLVFYVLSYKGSNLIRWFRGGLVGLATFFSLSSGAYVALAAQCGLITWDFSTRKWRHRWRLLGMLCIVAYVVVDMISNRSPIEVFIEYLTFSHHNSYNRILIWEYGTAEVWRHPVFGIGMTEWERPYWMSGSMDNFWLVAAIRYGLPAFIFFAGATILICLQLGRLQQIKPEIKQCRTGLLVSIGGLVIAGCTVHFWNATYCLFMFLLGSGMWMLDLEKVGQPQIQTRKARSTMRRIADQRAPQQPTIGRPQRQQFVRKANMLWKKYS